MKYLSMILTSLLLILLLVFLYYIYQFIKSIKALPINETKQKLELIKENQALKDEKKKIIDENLKPKLSFVFKIYLLTRLFKKPKNTKLDKAKYYIDGTLNIFN